MGRRQGQCKRKKNVAAGIGISKRDVLGADVDTSKPIDPDLLAKSIEIDEKRIVKPKMTSDVVGGSCGLCGKVSSTNKVCQNCGRMLCDQCAKTDATGRYCPSCFDRTKSLRKLL